MPLVREGRRRAARKTEQARKLRELQRLYQVADHKRSQAHASRHSTLAAGRLGDKTAARKPLSVRPCRSGWLQVRMADAAARTQVSTSRQRRVEEAHCCSHGKAG